MTATAQCHTPRRTSANTHAAKGGPNPLRWLRRLIVRQATAVRDRNGLREMENLPPHLQADIGFIPSARPPEADARSFNPGLGGTYW